jgi:hypothetical protein
MAERDRSLRIHALLATSTARLPRKTRHTTINTSRAFPNLMVKIAARAAAAVVILLHNHFRVLLDREELMLLRRVTRAKGSAILGLRATILKRRLRRDPIKEWE